jgi:hypothetical protein
LIAILVDENEGYVGGIFEMLRRILKFYFFQSGGFHISVENCDVKEMVSQNSVTFARFLDKFNAFARLYFNLDLIDATCIQVLLEKPTKIHVFGR